MLGVVVPSLASAQIPIAPPANAAGSRQTIDEVRKNYKVHAGPFYLDPAILLKELGVDTNVFNEAQEPRQDFTFTITPQADVAVPIARRGLIRTVFGSDFV